MKQAPFFKNYVQTVLRHTVYFPDVNVNKERFCGMTI